ncbi:MAG: gamma carbonic anhydrase family protein [Sphingomonadales bacterium]|nr:MAG: gamma carbonic anhydrase family protein [Sphingomonadales bacterium]
MRDVSLIPFAGKAPRIHPSAFIAPGCRIIGDVEIGEDASIWYNCVIRGDVNPISIGARTNIQDGSVVHCDASKGAHPGWPTIIGNDVLIGHMAMLHGCTLHDHALVGLGAVVMDGCTIAEDGMLGAGALLTPGKAIGARELWTGRPAKFLRDLDDAAVAGIRAGAAGYVSNAKMHAAACAAAKGI